MPFDYQYKLTGLLHKWLGKNDIHDGKSLYSFSWLKGDYYLQQGLNFEQGAKWFISFHDSELGKILIDAIQKDPTAIYGMRVEEIVIKTDPEYTDKAHLPAASPILVRDYSSNQNGDYLTPKHEDTGKLLTESIKSKMKFAGLDYEIKIDFDKTYPRAKTKLIDIKGIKHRANICPVIMEGDPEAIRFARNVGIGHLTGCGFGALE
jgi:CRISPR-associated endoribonuclease Cas6